MIVLACAELLPFRNLNCLNLKFLNRFGVITATPAKTSRTEPGSAGSATGKSSFFSVYLAIRKLNNSPGAVAVAGKG